MKRDYGVLRVVMAFAHERDLIGRTPCRNTRLPAVEPVDGHLITAEELTALAEALGDFGAALPRPHPRCRYTGPPCS